MMNQRKNNLRRGTLFAAVLFALSISLTTLCAAEEVTVPLSPGSAPASSEASSQAPSSTPSSEASSEPAASSGPASSSGSVAPDPASSPASAPSDASAAQPPKKQPLSIPFYWVLLGLLVIAAALVALWIRMGKPGFSRAKQNPKAVEPLAAEPADGQPEDGAQIIRTEQGDGLSAMIGNAHNIGGRDSQQDSFGISDITNPSLCMNKGIFAVVADGMGGLANGAQVSAIVTSTMLRQFESSPPQKDPSLELLGMVHRANQEVGRYLSGAAEESGSTVVAVLLKGSFLHFISVGDSRIYLVRQGALTQLNYEHTYANELDEKAARGEISLEQARSDPQRRALTSYIGLPKLEQIDRSLHPFPLVSGDRILLMSDGVFGTISEQDILNAVQADAGKAAQTIEQMVLAAQKPNQDNFTVVVLQCV